MGRAKKARKVKNFFSQAADMGGDVGRTASYQRRVPEQALLHQVFVEYLETFNTPFDLSDDIRVDFSAADGLPSRSIDRIRVDGFDEKWIISRDAGDTVPGLIRFDDNGTPADKADDVWVQISN
jgi:hypothetical protein